MISAERVREITKGSIYHQSDLPDDYKPGDKPENAIMIEGIVNMFGFNPDRVKRFKNEVKGILGELPETFRVNENGDTFLNGAKDKNGVIWGEHFDVECLMCVGMALGYITCPYPRSEWSTLYGEMPYYKVHLE
jgi:hypothetical protein